MKILLVTKNKKPNSGLGRYSKGVYDGLKKAGEDVSILSEDGDFFLLPKTNVFNFIRNCIYVRKVVKEFDVVHSLDAWPFGVYGCVAVWGTDKKFFIGGIGTYSIPPRYFSIKRTLLLLLYKRARGVFCISQYTLERIKERLPFRASLSVIYLAADKLPISYNKNLLSRFTFEPHAGPTFLTVGEVKERKGQLDTLIGLSSLKSEYPHFLYMLVGSLGDEKYVAKIKKKAEQLGVSRNIQFINNAQDDQDLSFLYQRSAVHFLNSNNEGDHFEGFGLVFLEANQFGIPGVGSKGCGIEDAISDGVSGILVGQKNHKAIAEAALEILRNKDTFDKGAKNWYTNFTWQRTIESYIKNYKK